jgi:hypothetical protein
MGASAIVRKYLESGKDSWVPSITIGRKYGCQRYFVNMLLALPGVMSEVPGRVIG